MSLLSFCVISSQGWRGHDRYLQAELKADIATENQEKHYSEQEKNLKEH